MPEGREPVPGPAGSSMSPRLRSPPPAESGRQPAGPGPASRAERLAIALRSAERAAVASQRLLLQTTHRNMKSACCMAPPAGGRRLALRRHHVSIALQGTYRPLEANSCGYGTSGGDCSPAVATEAVVIVSSRRHERRMRLPTTLRPSRGAWAGVSGRSGCAALHDLPPRDLRHHHARRVGAADQPAVRPFGSITFWYGVPS